MLANEATEIMTKKLEVIILQRNKYLMILEREELPESERATLTECVVSLDADIEALEVILESAKVLHELIENNRNVCFDNLYVARDQEMHINIYGEYEEYPNVELCLSSEVAKKIGVIE